MARTDTIAVSLPPARRAQWILIRSIRWGVHATALVGVFLVGFSWPAAVALAIGTLTGSLSVTLCYHRYFAHRSFKTSRWFQFLLALWGATSLQRGPIWWAAVHRHHHRHSDTDDDWHSPRHGLWHAHNGWLESPHILQVSYDKVKDLTRYPEMRFIDTFYHIPALLMIAILAFVGSYLQSRDPALGTSAWQMVIWGFFVRTVITWHLTFTTNSLLHVWGKQRFDTGDDSRNSYLFGILNLGDGFHNNHHRFASSARHGFYWWEIDITFYLIRFLEAMRLVSDVRIPPPEVLFEGRARGPRT